MILVIGGAGYIGSHMCKLLREVDEPHLVLDNLERGHAEALQGSRMVLGDLRDLGALDRVFQDHEIDLVMHFAAYIEVGESVREPAAFYHNNLVGVLNLLEVMNRHGVQQLVFSSTAAVFGEPERTPIDEGHPKNPTSPYGNTKLAVERMIEDFGRAYGLRASCLRYFNAAGAHPDGSIGEAHDPESHLVPLAIAAVLGRRPALKVFGDDYATPDGTCVRDYVHVVDLATAHLLALRRLRAGGESRNYNLGSGNGASVRQVIDTVGTVAGRQVPFESALRRPGDPAVLVASSELAKAELGWRPRYEELETIVRHAYRWHDTHPNGYGSADLAGYEPSLD
jgi:UDP-glucose 4-epimerase